VKKNKADILNFSFYWYFAEKALVRSADNPILVLISTQNWLNLTREQNALTAALIE